ncbi:MAG TPA: site-specific integrase [Ktedonobacteraceae bacterium]|nr:site-specific integrase [Ktedonobacteraceae bacterium]
MEKKRVSQREVYRLTIKQMKQLLEAAQEHDLQALMTVAVTTGLRRGELLGLCWQDIDSQNQFLQVRRMVSSFGLRTPTEAARTIALPTMTMRALQEYQVAHTGHGKPEHDAHPVFSNEKGQPLNPSALRQQYYPLFVAIGQPHLRFHDLRHSTAAFFYEMGVNIAVIHSILGFRYRSFTNALTPVSLSMQQEAMKKWDEVFGGA